MTNYVANHCVVEGPAEAIDAFEALALTEPVRDTRGPFARLIGRPPPFGLSTRGLDFERIQPTPPDLAADREALWDWRVEHWGVRHAGEDPGGRYERLGPTEARLVLYTPWSAPLGIFEALAPRLPPALTLRGAYVEQGNEYAGRFSIERGAFTRAFYEAVTGEPLDDDF